MATYVNYMNKVLKYLWDYRDNLFKYEKEYYMAKDDLYNKSTRDIEETASAYAHEIKIVEALRTATILYNELCDIAKRFQAGADVELELQTFNNKINSAYLPIFDRITITLKTVKDSSTFNGTMTGGAANLEETHMTDSKEELQEDSPMLLHGGLKYYHNTDSSEKNNDYYEENEIEGEEGYTGDRMEVVITNKHKYDEEQKKKAELQAKQNTTNQQNLQSSFTNWVLSVPKGHKITSGFGKRTPPVPGASDFHNGWDINLSAGTPVKAIADGKVVAVGPASGYGKWVAIDHGKINGVRVTSEYGHISRWCVSYGQQVKQGQIIAYSGNEGISSGPHLHITIREGAFQGKSVDPSKYIKKDF